MSATFTFNGNTYYFEYDGRDKSGLGCIREIVTNNEYCLDRFVDIEGNIIDIGANIGIATIILAKQNPLSRIFSFEPDVNVYKIAKKNIELNNLNNVQLFNEAVSDTEEQSILTHHPSMSGANTIFANNLFSNHYHIPELTSVVKTTSLDTIIKNHEIKSIDVLKIDCEGAEYNILYRSELFKDKIVKNIVGEFHSLKYMTIKDQPLELIEYCKKYVEGFCKISVLNI